jgi:hypothetical protein
MNRNALPKGLVSGLGALLILGLAPALLADGHHGCSLRGAAGVWGYTISGPILPDGVGAGVGIFTLDRSGSVTGTGAINEGDYMASETLSGTYTVNSDCTGSETLLIVDQDGNAQTVQFQLVWVDGMKELRMLTIDPNLIFTGNAKRLDAD